MDTARSFTVSEAAAELGLDVATVRRRLQRGDMIGVRVHPRLWLIPASEVERWRGKGKISTGRRRNPRTRENGERQ